ncbi:MAG: phosphoribosylaminoimidazolesuccinocarboxamide synthase, partial [Candidatus Thermoplasmatota archaeon]|nr:phosphoribosylaminoimidazolesuccinocarboxamide synthase [Candidatus Thermoplasmatota archaeon]
VFPNGIPSKGKILTQISNTWFKIFSDFPNHIISTDLADLPENIGTFKDVLDGRFMLIKKAKTFPIESIVRGYISGSAWDSYKKDKTVCGIKIKKNLIESEKFDEPLFTPSTKAESGHDINISYKKMEELIGKEDAKKIKEFSMSIYEKGAEYALKKGIIIADTKLEFGKINNEIILVDELLTPDSSRFWPADTYEPGKSQPSFDKQYVRDYLIKTGWDRNSKPPHLPEYVVKETEKKYKEAYERITGKIFKFKY